MRFGAFDTVDHYSRTVVGRKDWSNGEAKAGLKGWAGPLHAQRIGQALNKEVLGRTRITTTRVWNTRGKKGQPRWVMKSANTSFAQTTNVQARLPPWR